MSVNYQYATGLSRKRIEEALMAAGLDLGDLNDLGDLKRAGLGLHVFVDRFAEKAANLVRGLSAGRLRAVQAIAETRRGLEP